MCWRIGSEFDCEASRVQTCSDTIQHSWHVLSVCLNLNLIIMQFQYFSIETVQYLHRLRTKHRQIMLRNITSSWHFLHFFFQTWTSRSYRFSTVSLKRYNNCTVSLKRYNNCTVSSEKVQLLYLFSETVLKRYDSEVQVCKQTYEKSRTFLYFTT